MVTVLSFFGVVCDAAADTPPESKPPQTPVGISNVVIRIEGEDQIGLAGPDYRVRLIERMREQGFNAVGAESLVFDRDESHRAEFLVGGTVQELDCQRRYAGIRCRVGVEWQLLNVATDNVVYKVTTRGVVFDVPESRTPQVGSMLLFQTLDSLLNRAQFRAALNSRKPNRKKDQTYPTASFSDCAALSAALPAAAPEVLKASVVVKSGPGFGSGFFLTGDGLVLTAAHVVDSPNITLRTHVGKEVEAVIVRISHEVDVALLRPARALTSPCLRASTKPVPDVGSELYAVGTPASIDLAFTMTRGIVSSVRNVHGRPILQTDAPVSRGNSGGPMVDSTGAVVGIASSKLVGGSVEGIAFAVPIASALSALGLQAGSSTDPELHRGTWSAPARASETEAFTDTPDPVPSLDPEGDKWRAAQAEERKRARLEAERQEQERRRMEERKRLRDEATPTYVKAMYWGGLGLGVAGAATISWSYLSYDESSTRPEYDRLSTYNAIGWAAFGIGVGSFTSALILRPALPELPDADTKGSSRLVVGPGSMRWEGTF